MQRPGTDPDNVSMSDILCDFCHREWTEQRPMVEGHKGSVICGECLAAAYRAIILTRAGAPEGGGELPRCTMCIEQRREASWGSAEFPESVICARCTKLGASTLIRDKESGWSVPTE